MILPHCVGGTVGGREEVLASQLDFLGEAAAVVVALASVLATACQPASTATAATWLAKRTLLMNCLPTC